MRKKPNGNLKKKERKKKKKKKKPPKTTNQPRIYYLLDFKLIKASLHYPCQTLPI